MNKCGEDGCLKAAQSLYGSKFAPKNWYQHLTKVLIKIGFRECPFDKCLFYRKDMLMILYVDDAGIAAPEEKDIENLVEELRNEGFDLEMEGDFSTYLGIGIKESEDGTRCMTQKGLIERIIETTGMTDCNPNKTPASTVALGSDKEGEPWDQLQWNYASVVGMLLYVSNNTRPDITFAVSQVARFTACPKVSHAKAIKSIVRYLAGTKDKGIIFKLTGSFDLKLWVDADFAGTYGSKPSDSKDSVKSRYGCLVTFAGVLLWWKSKLIDGVCLSTTHAEYAGLSNAVRGLIPIRNMIKDTLEQLQLPVNEKPKVMCTALEDNQAAFLLATKQQLSVRSKYFAIKYHHFWECVYNEDTNPDGWLKIEKCSTDLMDADYLTKGLVKVKHDANRFRVQGW